MLDTPHLVEVVVLYDGVPGVWWSQELPPYKPSLPEPQCGADWGGRGTDCDYTDTPLWSQLRVNRPQAPPG